ncbi:uncharacterized protein [Primulina eburnea]|uniref:uncharacterized protein isoform X2 n=1 Tax=Primulina eburnea TaxID=1245227 RepID=UPI003C6CB195
MAADQSPIFPYNINETTYDAISSAEHLLVFDENYDDRLFDTVHIDNAVPFSGTTGRMFNFQENNNDRDGIHCNDFNQNPMQLSIWPLPPSPYTCTCCQTLREFFHTNGTRTLKLEIHGRLGIISHAIQERYDIDVSSQNHEYHMFDFCHESISNVKHFLVQYCEDRKKEGYILLLDPLSNFYDALCIGLDGIGGQNVDIVRGNAHPNQEDGLDQPVDEGNGAKLTKSYIASQREKTGKMKLRDLTGYFHLPISAASKEMNICPTALKNICRKEGLLRWPHRKIKSIKRQISEKKRSLNSNNACERARVLTQIHELEQSLADICGENVG